MDGAAAIGGVTTEGNESVELAAEEARRLWSINSTILWYQFDHLVIHQFDHQLWSINCDPSIVIHQFDHLVIHQLWSINSTILWSINSTILWSINSIIGRDSGHVSVHRACSSYTVLYHWSKHWSKLWNPLFSAPLRPASSPQTPNCQARRAIFSILYLYIIVGDSDEEDGLVEGSHGARGRPHARRAPSCPLLGLWGPLPSPTAHKYYSIIVIAFFYYWRNLESERPLIWLFPISSLSRAPGSNWLLVCSLLFLSHGIISVVISI